METFEIVNASELKIMFSERILDNSGWIESYLFSIIGNGINTSIRVDNPPYGSSPDLLFNQMNIEWSGWKESKSWEAIEGEFNIIATYEQRGHIILNAQIDNLSNNWKSTAEIHIEPSQLETFAYNANEFFKS